MQVYAATGTGGNRGVSVLLGAPPADNRVGPCQHDRRTTDLHTPNSFRVDIRDSGPGISTEHLDSIFEEYTSYSGGHDRSGGGLGLAICKLILSRHQGRIWAESSSDGAVFSFVLPFRLTDSPVSAEDNGFEKALL